MTCNIHRLSDLNQYVNDDDDAPMKRDSDSLHATAMTMSAVVIAFVLIDDALLRRVCNEVDA